MLIAHITAGKSTIVHRAREIVRLADGLDNSSGLASDRRQRALECLHRFAEHLRATEVESVRVVGTHAFRMLRNDHDFLHQVHDVLGYPVEILSGAEEAGLIYRGVVSELNTDPVTRLVVDIGGGSTEIVLGKGATPVEVHSLSIGCVTLANKFHRDGKITPQLLNAMGSYARSVIQPAIGALVTSPLDQVWGCSGTVSAIHMVASTQGWSVAGISDNVIRRLGARLLDLGEVDRLRELGVSDDRRSIFVSGFCLLSAVFELFACKHMYISTRALREGVIADLAG